MLNNTVRSEPTAAQKSEAYKLAGMVGGVMGALLIMIYLGYVYRNRRHKDRVARATSLKAMSRAPNIESLGSFKGSEDSVLAYALNIVVLQRPAPSLTSGTSCDSSSRPTSKTSTNTSSQVSPTGNLASQLEMTTRPSISVQRSASTVPNIVVTAPTN